MVTFELFTRYTENFVKGKKFICTQVPNDKLEEERDELAGAVNLDEPSSEEDMNIDI